MRSFDESQHILDYLSEELDNIIYQYWYDRHWCSPDERDYLHWHTLEERIIEKCNELL